MIPFIQNWAGSVNEPGPNGERSASFGGIGDINLTFKYRLVEETETGPHGQRHLFPHQFPHRSFQAP